MKSRTTKLSYALATLLLVILGVQILPSFATNILSGGAILSSLEIKKDGINLLSGFSSGTDYYEITLEEIADITVSAIPGDAEAHVDINLNSESDYSNHSLVSLSQGENVLIVKVNKGLSFKEYTINIATPIPPVIENYFTWDNALVYFVLTDRFYNGDPSNDESYYRNKSLGGGVATFHGGDIKGLTSKLDYLEDLGVNAIWITAPYEQIHGWVSGKDDKFPHYAFHGYYTQDWTYMDKNMGTIDEFRTFVDDAHSRGIRIVMDIVLNHTGYNTIEDMISYDFGSTTVTEHGWVGNGNWSYNHDVTDYESQKWSNWWSGWARGFGGKFGFGTPGGDDLKLSLAGLPDIMTENTASVSIPAFLKKKWQTETSAGGYGPWMLPSADGLRSDNLGAPADYIIKWLVAWVREFGIDGFRCDTAKHVEKSRWKQLKAAAIAALEAWRNDTSKSSGSEAKDWTDNFWMTGEDFGHGLNLNSTYYTEGDFDSMINFSFNGTSGGSGSTPSVESWTNYANTINNNSNSRNVLSYFSSHDTGLHRPGDMKNAGTMLVLMPGGVQIFYGDETARPKTYTNCGDVDMMTRGDMNWDAVDGDVNTHWKKLGRFRKRNAAVGAGAQTSLGDNAYGRKYTNGDYSNAVVIKLNTSSGTSYTVNVSGIFEDGVTIQDGYNTDNTAKVSGGKVTMNASGPVMLLEKQTSSVPPPVPGAPVVSATPSSQTFSESVTVNLSVTPSVAIYYTTDGTVPSTSSARYTSALTFTETTTLKAYAEKDGKSSTGTFTYTKSGGSQSFGKSLETAYYATNPNGKAGTNKTINMSIANGVSSSALSNWTANELIAQGAARDICQAFRGGHEFPLYDSYALYAAWDDTYLYLGWQFVNVINEGVGDAAKPYNADIRQMLVFDLDPNVSCDGTLTTGSTIWDAPGTILNTFNNGMDAAAMFSSKPTNGTPGIFLPDANGKFSYEPKYCLSFEANSYGYADGLLSSITSIYGINEYGFDPALLEGETGFTDLMSGHNKANDTFYEMKIPLAKLGITKSYIESTGIGVMHISTYGAGAIGSIPYDPTVYDNALLPYSADESSSMEKEDLDIFTYNMARIGRADGGIVTPPNPAAPVVASDKADNTTFEGDLLTLTLTVTGTDVTVVKYTTDGNEPSDTRGISFTNGQAIQVNTSSIAAGEYLTLKLYAKNAAGTASKTYKYQRQKVIEEPALSLDFNSLTMYQVMVSSFQDGASVGYGTGYGPSHHNGDLRGIINALDYIKGLGANALWMTPIFDSRGGSGGTNLNSTGYFCTDYFNVDPNFGTNDDFRELVQKAHNKGLYVILDGVFGHHGGNVKASPGGKYPAGGNDPVSYPGSLDFYKEVATYWINEYEIDGWRLDQCYQVSYKNQDKNYWKDIREAVEATCSTRKAQGKTWGTLGYMVGEDWDSSSTIQNRTYGGDGLMSAFDFPGRYNLVNTFAAAESDTGGNDISSLAYIYKTPSEKGYSHSKGVYPNMFITNHDVWRFGNLIRKKYSYGKENDAYWRRHKIALAALAAYTGPITLYYGDEIGDIAECWNGNSGSCGGNVYGDNVARTNGTISGFDSKQQNLHDWTAKIMKIRQEHPACWRGNNSIKNQSNGVLANLKYDSVTGDKILFVLNNGTNSSTSVTVNCGGSQLVDLVSGTTITGSGGSYTIPLEGLSARFFEVK